MKHYFYFFLSFLLFTACKPTSAIITSKEIAEKKGIYTSPEKTTFTNINSSSVETEKKVSKKEKETVVKTSKKKTEPNLQYVTENKKSVLNNNNADDIFVDSENTAYIIEQLINFASDNLGVSYRGGGMSKEGFDCSGLIYTTFKNYDVELPRSSYDMAKIGKKLDLNEIKKGDLIFFKTNGKSRINHVGMIVEIKDDEIKFIHSSTHSGVIVSSTKETYYKKSFAQVNRILEN